MTPAGYQSRPVEVAHLPLCVDLDGTLVKSDTLVDSLLVLVRTRPVSLLQLPLKVLRGKAAFKEYVATSAGIDVAHLPYNRGLVRYLEHMRDEGCPIYLTTGADRRIADAVAEHLGIFSGVISSDGVSNVTGSTKLDRLKNWFGNTEFNYIGNDVIDMPILKASSEPMLANPTLGLRLRVAFKKIAPARVFEERRHFLRSFASAIRVHQWTKNALMFVPLLLAHTIGLRGVLAELLAFVCFSLVASANYIVNDLLDIQADRRHLRKRLRPFAAGDLSAMAGLTVAVLFLLLGFAGAQLLPVAFQLWLLVYLVTTFSYSFFLKRIALVDVLVLSGLYTLRIQAGAAATETPISHWLAGFSIFLFLSLAFVKRFAELENLRASGLPPRNGRGYLVADIEQLRAFGTGSFFAAVVVFAIYISSRDVTALYRHPSTLWLIVPMLILWLSRVWLLASRGELDEDPVVFALTDRFSLVIGMIVTALVIAAL